MPDKRRRNRRKKKSAKFIGPLARNERRRKPRTRRARTSMSIMPFVHGVCSLTDPFCPHAMGALYPDATAGKVMTEQIRYTINPTNDGNGRYFVGFQANPFYPQVDSTGVVGVASCATAATLTAVPYTLLAANAKAIRVVTWGVRVINTASMTGSGGSCSMMVGDCLQLSATVAYAPNGWNFTAINPLAHGAEFTFISRPVGSGARDFIPLNTYNASNYLNEDWETLYWFSTAQASTATLLFEVYFNIEFTVNGIGNAFAMMAKQSPPQNNLLTTATSTVQARLTPVLMASAERVGKRVENAASNAIVKLIGGALGGVVGGLAGGPAGAGAGFGAGMTATSMLMAQEVD